MTTNSKAYQKAYYQRNRERFKREQEARSNKIGNRLLREAIERKDVPLLSLAEFMDMPDPKKSAQRISRSLGKQPSWDDKGVARHRERISYDFAVRIARAAHIDPVDVGL